MAGRLFCHAGRDNIFLHGIWDSLFYTLLYARERVQEVYVFLRLFVYVQTVWAQCAGQYARLVYGRDFLCR